jgi:phage host-nuclease inhibitor protein Gam
MAGKAKVAKLKNWEEATDKLGLYREAKCALDKKLAAKAEAVRRVEESYQIDVDGMTAEVNEYAGELRAFAEARKAEFVAKEEGGEGRTRFRHGVEIGWRWGNPYIHIPKKAELAAIAGLEEIAADTYVKRSPKIMRDLLNAELVKAQEKGDSDSLAFIGRMAKLHITLDQDEEFVLELVSTS